MKLLRFHLQGLYFQSGMVNLQEFRRFLGFPFLFSSLPLPLSFTQSDIFRYWEIPVRMLKTSRSKKKKKIYPFSNEDHTAANILTHLIVKSRVNHVGNCEIHLRLPSLPLRPSLVHLLKLTVRTYPPHTGPALPSLRYWWCWRVEPKSQSWSAPSDVISLCLSSFSWRYTFSHSPTIFILCVFSCCSLWPSSSFLRLPLSSRLMHRDTNEVGLRQAKPTRLHNPNQPQTHGCQEPYPHPQLHHALFFSSVLPHPLSAILTPCFFTPTAPSHSKIWKQIPTEPKSVNFH